MIEIRHGKCEEILPELEAANRRNENIDEYPFARALEALRR